MIQSCHLIIFWSDQHDFVNYYIIYFSFFLFLSFIAQGLAMCQLGGVITTQRVLFYTFNSISFKHFCVVILHLYSNWHIKDLAMTSNIFVDSFSVLTAFWIIKTSQVKERSKEKQRGKASKIGRASCRERV